MNVKLLPLLAAGITLLSGCNRGADVSENIPELPTSEAAYRSDSAEAAGDPAFSDSPAGLFPLDNISDTVPDTIPPTDDYGNVSLVRDKYDYLREMTDFPGQYYQLEELGYECVTVPAEVSERYGNASIADGELLYFQNIEFDEWGYAVTDLTVTEYNIITREAVSFELPTKWYALYIDRDYAVYKDQGWLALFIRESGETVALPESEKYYPSMYYNRGVKRVGQSFYYNISEEFSNADGSMSFDSRVLCRYMPRVDRFEKLAADMDIIGATSQEILCKSSGGLIYRYGGWVDGYFELPYDYLYTAGTYMGYISPATAETLFGRRYEVGRVLTYDTTDAYQLPIFMTHFGTYAYNMGITSDSVAFVELCGQTGNIVLAVDINANMAADTGYDSIICCGSDRVYLRDFDNDNILAINTSSPTNADSN